jgi:hypothetical protein
MKNDVTTKNAAKITQAATKEAFMRSGTLPTSKTRDPTIALGMA